MNEDLRILKALSDETRLNLLKMIMNREKCCSEILPVIKKSQSTISIQLSKLENLGIINARRQGKKVFYRISNDKAKKVIELLSEQSVVHEENEKNTSDFLEEV